MRRSIVTVSDASGGAKSSNAVMIDYYGWPQVAVQCVVTGTVNYTVQFTLDDIQSVASPTWTSSTDTGVVGATSTKTSRFDGPISAVKVLLNSGTGSVTMTVLQAGINVG